MLQEEIFIFIWVERWHGPAVDSDISEKITAWLKSQPVWITEGTLTTSSVKRLTVKLLNFCKRTWTSTPWENLILSRTQSTI